jgi:putative transposase
MIEHPLSRPRGQLVRCPLILGIPKRQLSCGGLTAAKALADDFSGFPKVTAKIMDELDTLLAFYDFPKERSVHLRTTNPIESTFSTVRLRTGVTRGAGPRKATLAMAYKLLDAGQAPWHKIVTPEVVPLVPGRRHLRRRQTAREEVDREEA